MHITYEQLLEIVSWGVFSKPMKGISCYGVGHLKSKKIKEAMHGGVYTGSPGKDIYLMLPYMSEEQICEVASLLCKHFPKTPPDNHVNVAACIRFIYGQFEKQGILRSKKDFKRMKKEELDWELPRKFLKYLYLELEKDRNYYGLSILCEMEGHRLGDEAVLKKDENKILEMEKTYLLSVNFAHKCKSYKQMFTPYYWASIYFIKIHSKEKALEFCKSTIRNAEKYCPDARDSYVSKILYCISYMKNYHKKEWNYFYEQYKNNIRNKCVKKAFRGEGTYDKKYFDFLVK